MIKFKIAPCALSIFVGLLSMYFSTATNVSAVLLEEGPPTEEVEDDSISIDEAPPGDLSLDESIIGSKVIFQAVNPGYSSEQGNDKNELIELKNNTGESVDLSGISIRYTYGSSRKQTTIYEFAEGSEFNGEYLLLRYNKSPESKEFFANPDLGTTLPIADDFYTTTLAASGGKIELLLDMDYGTKESVESDFEVLDTICWFNEEGCEKPLSGKRKGFTIYRTESGFEASDDYLPHFTPEKSALFTPEAEPEFEEETTEEDLILESKEKASEKAVDKTSNLKPCAEGYERNPETNRCRKIQTEESELKECAEGYERNPETNRCKKIQTTETELKECQEGYERNPETNRCRKIQTEEAELKECAEGYERNPETNRCRKIKENTGAEYSVEVPATGEVEEKSTFVALVVIIAIASVGVLYVFFQYRKELSQAVKKILKRQ